MKEKKTFGEMMSGLEENYGLGITKTALEVGKLLNGLSVTDAELVICLVRERFGELSKLEFRD